MAAQNMTPRLRNIRDRILGVLRPDRQVIIECRCFVAYGTPRAPTGVIPVVEVDCLLTVYMNQNLVLFQWLRAQEINYIVWCPLREHIMGNGHVDQEAINLAPNEVWQPEALED